MLFTSLCFYSAFYRFPDRLRTFFYAYIVFGCLMSPLAISVDPKLLSFVSFSNFVTPF